MWLRLAKEVHVSTQGPKARALLVLEVGFRLLRCGASDLAKSFLKRCRLHDLVSGPFEIDSCLEFCVASCSAFALLGIGGRLQLQLSIVMANARGRADSTCQTRLYSWTHKASLTLELLPV